MNKYDLFDAFGGVDDGLLERSEHKAVRRFPIRKAVIAAAAVMLLAVTALAAPAVREWFFSSDLTSFSDANIIYWSATATTEDGKPYAYEVSGYQNSEARIDMNLEGIGDTPATIQELRIPTFFESGNWEYTPYVRYPDDLSDRYIGQWNRWIEVDEIRTNQYILFQQNIVYRGSAELPTGLGQFYISTGNNAPIEQTTLTIDDREYQIFLVGESVLGDMVYPAETNIVWSDGEYAYLITATNVDTDMISEIIRSIAPVRDPSDYICDAVYDPVETYYTLSVLPEDLSLTNTEDNGYYTWQLWGGLDRGVDLWQQRIQSEGSDVDNLDLTLTLSDLRRENLGSRIEHIELDGIEVSLIWFEEDVYAYWTQDDCDFTLCFFGYPDLSADQIGACITGLVPTESFPE